MNESYSEYGKSILTPWAEDCSLQCPKGIYWEGCSGTDIQTIIDSNGQELSLIAEIENNPVCKLKTKVIDKVLTDYYDEYGSALNEDYETFPITPMSINKCSTRNILSPDFLFVIASMQRKI